MSEREKTIAKKMAEAIKALPDEKKEYVLGFAEGVAAMKRKEAEENVPVSQPDPAED